jgi:cyclopropane fatty-acyl-phospholipid synthase-like methyltransferase
MEIDIACLLTDFLEYIGGATVAHLGRVAVETSAKLGGGHGEKCLLPFSDACERNKGPILEVLQRAFADRSVVLEIGSGTGQHAVHFATHLPHLSWLPTDRLANLASLASRINLEAAPNIRLATVLDVTQKVWPARHVDAVFSANTLHIMSWAEVMAMFAGIEAVLLPGGVVCVYGPFRYRGRHTALSNERFDAELRERDPESGIREIDEVTGLAAAHRLRLAADHELPANNRLLQFVRSD